MRLVDLNPKWLGVPPAPDGTGERRGVRMAFDCPARSHDGVPCHARWSGYVANPLDGGPPKAPPGTPAWTRIGESFEALTLTPSVDWLGHWHGNITAGEIR